VLADTGTTLIDQNMNDPHNLMAVFIRQQNNQGIFLLVREMELFAASIVPDNTFETEQYQESLHRDRESTRQAAFEPDEHQNTQGPNGLQEQLELQQALFESYKSQRSRLDDVQRPCQGASRVPRLIWFFAGGTGDRPTYDMLRANRNRASLTTPQRLD
jgi:hypothetical protein